MNFFTDLFHDNILCYNIIVWFLQHYSSSGFSDNQIKMLQHFRDYGLVYMRSGKRPSSRFYPTNLVVNLSGGANHTNAAFAEGYIVVETNYRIIA